jgi:hypothetical protein
LQYLSHFEFVLQNMHHETNYMFLTSSLVAFFRLFTFAEVQKRLVIRSTAGLRTFCASLEGRQLFKQASNM